MMIFTFEFNFNLIYCSKHKGSNKHFGSKSSKYQLNTRQIFKKSHGRSKCYIFDICNLTNIKKELAKRYIIVDANLEQLCEQNMNTAIQYKRFDIAKVNSSHHKFILPTFIFVYF